jgi:GMP synthase (glutamine-hydrolysing)
MRPFLFLGTRAEDQAADDEYAAVLRCAGLDEPDLRRVRLERCSLDDALGTFDLDDWSGILLGGGPFNSSDPEDTKSDQQRRAEADLRGLAAQVLERDSPFLGACYGIGVLGALRGGTVDRTYGEPIGCVEITLTADGERDPLLGRLPRRFNAFLGHKEAVRELPAGAVRLAGSTTCPVQAFRMGANVYATQFHPELDVEGLCTRVEVYRDYGYFPPGEVRDLQDMARRSVVTEPARILAGFVERYARD